MLVEAHTQTRHVDVQINEACKKGHHKQQTRKSEKETGIKNKLTKLMKDIIIPQMVMVKCDV